LKIFDFLSFTNYRAFWLAFTLADLGDRQLEHLIDWLSKMQGALPEAAIANL
jgi:hypothetical protein